MSGQDLDDEVVAAIRRGVKYSGDRRSCTIGSNVSVEVCEKLAEIFELLGGKPVDTLRKSFSFDRPIDYDRLTGVGETGEHEASITERFFETPDWVIDRMIALVGGNMVGVVLEPSAGNGAILRRVIGHRCAFIAYEINKERANALREEFGEKAAVVNLDFMGVYDGAFLVDYVLMAPPLDELRDISHIMHAATFLNVVGKLVAVASGEAVNGPSKESQVFREFLAENNAAVEPLPLYGDMSVLPGVQAYIVLVDREANIFRRVSG